MSLFMSSSVLLVVFLLRPDPLFLSGVIFETIYRHPRNIEFSSNAGNRDAIFDFWLFEGRKSLWLRAMKSEQAIYHFLLLLKILG